MEGKKRSPTLWIVLAILVVVLCCAAIAVALLIGLFTWSPVRIGGGAGVEERLEQSFDVGRSARLVVNSFAGDIHVHDGEQGTIQVVAVKHAPRSAGLDAIDVRMQPTDQGLQIAAERSGAGFNNTTVEFDIAVPPGTRVEIDLGAGNVELRDTAGEIEANTGAGTIDVSGNSGPARLEVGAGTISFRGAVRGDYTFRAGVGEINIALPADAGASVNLTTGLGEVSVGFPVDGQVTDRDVRGTIGTGRQATIEAHTGTGSIKVVQQ